MESHIGSRQIGQNVEVVHRTFDHQRVGDPVAEFAPATGLAAVTGEPADQVIECPMASGAQLIAQGRLVLVEAVTHGHAHFHAGAP